jgi:serine/threonine protein kinase
MTVADVDLVERANARVGMLLKGKYTLDRVLGIGGMATVYAATHRNGKEFAIKVLHADLSMRSEMRMRFLREGYLANRVNHPGAVAVLDDDVGEDGGAFLVMELLQGQTVEAIWELQRGKLPLPFVSGIALQLLDVLAAAHGRGLIHRDIKPGNIMLTQDGYVKVLDFGIARLRDVASAKATQTGMVMGTPAFMAPEHALAKTESIDAQTDLWAVGATMFTLVTGQLVHEAENAQQILVKAATMPARPLATLLPKAPEMICEIVDRALAFNKADRWPNATAMQKALRTAAEQAFNEAPNPARLSEMLDEMVEHEKTNLVVPAAGVPAEPKESSEPTEPKRAAQPDTDSSELPTGSGVAAAKPAPAPATLAAGSVPGRPHDAPAADPVQASPREQPPAARAPASPVARERPLAAGMITAEAMATDSAMRRTLSKPRSALAVGGAAAALGVVAILVFAMRSGSSSDATTAGSAAHATAVAAPSVPSTASPSVAKVANTVDPSWTAVPTPPPAPGVSAVSATAVSPQSLPTAAPPVVQAAPRPRPAFQGASPATLTPSGPAAAPAPNKPNCNPPYEFDANGNKRWKRECL